MSSQHVAEKNDLTLTAWPYRQAQLPEATGQQLRSLMLLVSPLPGETVNQGGHYKVGPDTYK